MFDFYCKTCYEHHDIICEECAIETNLCLNCIHYGEGELCDNCFHIGDEGICLENDLVRLFEWIEFNNRYFSEN